MQTVSRELKAVQLEESVIELIFRARACLSKNRFHLQPTLIPMPLSKHHVYFINYSPAFVPPCAVCFLMSPLPFFVGKGD